MKNGFINIKPPPGFNIKKYEGKRILVIGGGPTTNLINWQNIKYDYVFTCNQYFECDKLNNVTVDITSLINRILKKANSTKLQNRLDKDNSYIAIEPYHSSMVFDHMTYKELTNKYKDKCIFFDTTFQNKSGTAPRLAILAAASLNIKLFNLSEDYSENIMSKYSKINFPLPKELKKQLV